MTLGFGAAPAAAAPEGNDEPCCDCWGEISPENPTASLSEESNPYEVTFYAGGTHPSCGFDVSTCTWTLDANGLGTLSDTAGTEVVWTAPMELEDCISEEFKLTLECTEPYNLDETTITLQCDDDDKSWVTDGETSIGGGGCNSPQSTDALLFLPLPLLVAARRRMS